MSYAGYRGRCQGRLLHALSVYAQSYYDLREHSTIGDGRIMLGGKLAATYSWEDDIPVFTFNYFDLDHPQTTENLTRTQFFFRPFLDEHMLRLNLPYIVQEVRRSISLEQALEVRHARDEWEGNWANIDREWGQVVRSTIMEKSGGTFNEKAATTHWKHVVLCAIYDI